jgi:hypothetical protein
MEFLEEENERVGDFNRKVQKDTTAVTKQNEGYIVRITPSFFTV